MVKFYETAASNRSDGLGEIIDGPGLTKRVVIRDISKDSSSTMNSRITGNPCRITNGMVISGDSSIQMPHGKKERLGRYARGCR